MNARAAIVYFSKALVPTVTSKTWIHCDQPELHLTLSNFSHVKIQWDLSYGHRLIFFAEPGGDFVSSTAQATGMNVEELEGYVDEVYRAVQADEAERMADQWADADNGEYDR